MRLSIRDFIFASLLVLTPGTMPAQVAITVTNPTNTTPNLATSYTSLAAAVTALNTITAISGPVIMTASNGSETAPAGGYVISFTATTSAVNNIVITGSATTTITAGLQAAAGSEALASNDAIFKIVGADWITIQSFTMQENAGNTVTTAGASNTMTEFGVLLVHKSTTDGAQNNTVQNNVITLNATYVNSIGIFSSSAMNGVAPFDALDATSTAGTNSNNKIYGNTISNVAYGIYFICPPITATVFETGNDIGGTSALTGNTITSENAAPSTAPWNRAVLDVQAGILYRNGAGNGIRFNSISTTSNAGNFSNIGGVSGILISSGTAPSGVTYTSTISNNTVVVTSTGVTPISGIDFGHGSSNGTIVGNDNNVTLHQMPTGHSTNAVTGIKANYVSATNTCNSNTVTINQSQTSIMIGGNTTGITQAGSTTTLNNNSNTVTIRQAASAGMYVNTITFIDASANSSTINVQNNNLNTTGSTLRSTGAVVGILQDATASVLVDIQNNTMTVDRVATFGSIMFQFTSSNSVDAKDIVSNNIITFTNLAGSTTATAISNMGGSAFPLLNNKAFNNNTINISGTHTGATIGIVCASVNAGFIQDNSITLSSAAASVTGIATASTTTAMTFSGNNIGLTSSATVVTGMAGMNIGGVNAHSIMNNTISAMNLTGVITGTPVVSGISVSGGTDINFFGNTIINFSVGAATSTASPIVDGITFSASSGKVFKNKIYGLNTAATGASTTVSGIRLLTSNASTISNNLIGNLTAGAATSPNAVRGINITSVINPSINEVYYNTIYLTGGGGTNFGSSGIFHTASTNTATATLDLRNNIIVNNTTPNGTGLAVAYRRSAGTAGTLANYAGTSNNNLFFAGVPGGSTNQLIYSDGTSNAQNLAAYKAGVFTAGTIAARDNVSITENPAFLSTSGASASFLHLDPAVPTQLESGAAPVAGINDDYDADVRHASLPDIGADEGNFILFDIMGPAITYTAFGPIICAIDRALSPVTITDAGGVNVNPGTRPRLYFKKSTNANTFADNTSGTNGWKYVEATGAGGSPFSFTTDYSLLFGGVPTTGNVIQYFVVAQDNASTPNIGISSGTFATPPGSVALTAAAFPLTGTIKNYTLIAGLSGSLNVGPAEAITTLTAAGGLFSLINANGMSGDLTARITGNITTEDGANALNALQFNGCPAGPFTLLIKPTGTFSISGSTSGALIKLNGADYVTIDGSTGSTPNTLCPLSAASRNLTITNTSTGTSSAVVWLQSNGTDGSTHNTIQNCIIVGSRATAGTLVALGSGSSTIGVAASSAATAPNHSNRFINNKLSKASFGIVSFGPSATDKNTSTIINQNVINTASPNQISKGGIFVGFDDGVTISGNIVANITNTNNYAWGISCGLQTTNAYASFGSSPVTNATITGNVIGSIRAGSGYGVAGIAVAEVLSGTTFIANNMISDAITNGTGFDIGAGIYLDGGAGSTIKIYYNSVRLSGALTGGQNGNFGIAIRDGNPLVDLKNNIVTNTASNGTYLNRAIGLGYPPPFDNFISNNNDLFVSGTGNSIGQTGTLSNSGFIVGTTLADWQAQTNQDMASQNVAPVCISTTDLHLFTAGNALLNGTGTPVSVAADIDCQLRNATAPDIGADEFESTVTLNLTAFIEGYMNGAAMRPVLMNSGVGMSATACDNITVELHNPTAPYALAYTFAGVLQTNGTLTCTFPGDAFNQSYYVVLKHRNALEIWSAAPVSLSANTSYNFSSAAAQAYGSNLVQVGSLWTIYSGDMFKDNNVDFLDYPIWENDYSNFAFGYIASDLNGDGVVDFLDYPIWEQNYFNFISTAKP